MLNSVNTKMAVSLKGKCFISTRPEGKSKELKDALHKLNAELIEFPMIELSQLECNNAVNKVLNCYTEYTHIAFTSVYGFEFFLKKVNHHPQRNNILSKLKIVSIGYKTSETIRNNGFKIDLDANAKTGEEFAKILAAYIRGKNARIIWATGVLSPNVLVEKVGKVAEVVRVDLYNNSLPDRVDNNMVERIKSNEYDMLILASPSAVKNLFALVSSNDLRVVCIGLTTASEAERYGIQPLAVANEPSSKGIVDAILNYYEKHP